MDTTAHRPVVVGIDGSNEATAAAGYAAWEAQRRGVGLRLVYAHQPTPLWGPAIVVTGEYDWQPGWVRDLLRNATKAVVERYPTLPVEAVAALGGPAGVLVAESEDASVVVTASRATGGLRGHLAGSVSAQVAAHASCPVVVLRSTEPRYVERTEFGGLPVVVGLDGSEESQHAVGFAAEEAVARGSDLHAVFVWDILRIHDMGPAGPASYDLSAAEVKAERLLAEATAGLADRYPDLVVRRRPLHAPDAVEVLAHPALGAGLLVLGSRGHGGFLGLRLGSTVDGLIRHSAAPVAVVRGQGDDPR
jgi:nucleotide-binding universal stress UspA family protein